MILRRRLAALVMMALLCAAAAATAAPKKDPTPTAHAQRAGLTHIVEQVQHAAQRGERPVVIVDIDDTVLDRSVLHRLATGNGKDGLLASRRGHSSAFDAMLSRFEAGEKKLERDLYYLLGARGMFSSRVRGVHGYLRAIEAAGGQVIFVTARQASWRADTHVALDKAGLLRGLGRRQRPLVMRPDGFNGSSRFKEQVVRRIGGKRRVVALFDDKPKNLRSMKRAVPEAIAVQVTFKPDRGTHVGGDMLVVDFKHTRPLFRKLMIRRSKTPVRRQLLRRR